MDYLDLSTERAYPTPYAASHLLPLLLLSLASQKHSPRTKTVFRQKYDYIVVGAGSAGSVVASRLSEIPCVSVLLLEAGKAPPRLTEIPGIPRSFIGSDLDWNYYTEPQKYTGAGLIDRRVPWPSGKTLGGSSTLSGNGYVRGNRRNYDEWASLGAEGWSYEDVLPYFKKLEDNTDPAFLATGYHGVGGPVTISSPSYEPEVKLTEIEELLGEGYSFIDPNGGEQIGIYNYQGSIRNGQRCSTAKAYLVPSENRQNLDILSNAFVRKILIENKRAVGVEFDFNGFTQQVMAEKEVILSAGTTNTAQLLMLSGIGPMSELKKFNIPLIADLPVGFNFKDHVGVGLVYEVDDRLRPFAYNEQLKKEVNIQDYIANRKGPLTVCQGVYLMAYLSNPDSKDNEIPDYCLYLSDFENIFYSQIGYTAEVISKTVLPLSNKTTITCFTHLLHPLSTGTVSIRSTNPYDPPVIDPNYLSDFRDVNDLLQGLKACQKIFSSPAMKKLGAKPADIVFPGCEEFVQDVDLYLRCYIRSVVVAVSHQIGTAKMGNPKDPTTVVDSSLRVKGIRRLRVVDASVMPTIPWANMNIPTIMVAEKASDIIKSTIQC